MAKKKSAIEKIVSASQKENAINKRISNYSLKAIKKIKNDFEEKPSKPIKYKKNSLLDNIISSSMRENEINKRLEQISYSAINGERQKEETYKPEGVQMLGTLGREKPLEAITKEMIKEYQEEEQKPYIIDGEVRKYMKADYRPILQVPESLDDIKDELKLLYNNKLLTIRNLTEVEKNINLLDDYYRGLIRDINVFGLTEAKKNDKINSERDMVVLREEYDLLKKDLEKIEYEIKRKFELGKEIKKENALIPQKNKEEIKKYEEALMNVNKSRLNIQQQPNESDAEYYQRLKDVEAQKYDPLLYKKYSLNKVSKELKPKLEGIFKDEGMIENIIKSLSDEDKMFVNKNFNKIEEDFIKKYGYNPSMNVKTAVKEILSSLDEPASKIKALIKRVNAQNLYIPELKMLRESEERERENENALQTNNALETLKAVFKRKKIEPKFLKVLNKSREIEETERAKDLMSVREKQQAKMDELASTKKALSKISSAISRKKAMEELKKKKAVKKLEGTMKTKHISGIYNEGIQNIRPLQKLQAVFKRSQPESRLIGEQIKDTALINRELKRIEEEKKMIENEREVIRKLSEIRLKQALRKGIRERAKSQPSPVPSSILSGANTEQEERERASLRFPRSDIGIKRMPYATEKNIENALLIQSVLRGHKGRKKFKEDSYDKIFEENELQRQAYEIEEARAMLSNRKKRADAGKERAKYDTQKARDKAFIETLTPEEKKLINVGKRAGKTISEVLNEIRKSKKEGSGLRRLIMKKKKVLTENAIDKDKNRLRLVMAQYKAGNDNPKLINELNKLYKKLYKIDNAHMLIKTK